MDVYFRKITLTRTHYILGVCVCVCSTTVRARYVIAFSWACAFFLFLRTLILSISLFVCARDSLLASIRHLFGRRVRRKKEVKKSMSIENEKNHTVRGEYSIENICVCNQSSVKTQQFAPKTTVCDLSRIPRHIHSRISVRMFCICVSSKFFQYDWR